MDERDEYLPLSGIQHFAFCRRRWALIHIECKWEENRQTAEGRVQHETVHDEDAETLRGSVLTTHGMRVFSHRLKLQGACDTVEFHLNDEGVPLAGRPGLWLPYPIEFKHGQADVSTEADALQLCAQAMCLEEMLLCRVEEGALFYRQTRRRTAIRFDDEIREKTLSMAEEMNAMFLRGHTPKAKRKPVCKSCSMADLCLPSLFDAQPVTRYIQAALREENAT